MNAPMGRCFLHLSLRENFLKSWILSKMTLLRKSSDNRVPLYPDGLIPQAL